MNEEQFTKLFKYMEKRFNIVDEKFKEAVNDRADICGAIAKLSVQVRDYHNEMKFIHTRWINYVMQYFKLPKRLV